MKRAINRGTWWVLILACPVSVNAAELTEEIIQRVVNGNLEAFEEIEIPAGGEGTSFSISLGETVAGEGEFSFGSLC